MQGVCRVAQGMAGNSTQDTRVIATSTTMTLVLRKSISKGLESMCATEPNFDTKERHLCFECVGEKYLRAEIERDGDDGTCFYSGKDRKALSTDQVANSIYIGISGFFERPVQYPPDVEATLEQMARDEGKKPPDKGLRVADLIKEEAGICATATEDVRRALAERYPEEPDIIGLDETGFKEGPFDPEARYVKRESVDAWDFEGDWSFFEKSLKREARYFSRIAEEILATVFDGISNYNTIDGRSLVVEEGPGTELARLYRARVFQSEEKLEEALKRPDMHVGPPPSSVAVAGRMNAAGIAVFYGATSADVALAEVRPPVGSKVLVGCFQVVRSLKLLDLEALEFVADEQGSIFDADHIHRLKRAKFLRGLGQRVSRPVMPDDQPRDYIPTQAVADFLATLAIPPLDGILYPSVQVGHARPSYARRLFRNAGRVDSRNVVLFQKAASVQALNIPAGADISVFNGSHSLFGLGGIDDHPEVDYAVFEKMTSTAPSPEQNDSPLKFSALEVHYVKGVKFDTVSRTVPRYRGHELELDEGA
jgi:hypothetical protein